MGELPTDLKTDDGLDPDPPVRDGRRGSRLHGSSQACVSPPPLALTGATVTAEGVVHEPPRERARRALVLLAVAVGITIVASVVLSNINQTGAVHKAFPGGATHVLTRLSLAPTAAQPTAGGTAAVVRAGTNLVLLVQAHGLAPNGHDVYAVWLAASRKSSHLLGLVSPPVGAAGTLSSGAPLPPDVSRFTELILTRETNATPVRPGQMVLTSPFRQP